MSWRALIAALAAVGAALAAAAIAGGILPGGRSREVLAYAVGTLPLAAAVGGIAGRLGGRPRASGPRSGAGWGLLGALLGALIVALFQAAVRFRATGAEGFLSLAALPYPAELGMLAGPLQAFLYLGATLRRLPFAAAAGALASLLIGPTLILTALLGQVGWLNPAVVTALVVAGAAVRRRIPG